MQISKNYLAKPSRDPNLHSPNHVLADELCQKFGEKAKFAFYLGIATRTNHAVIKRIVGQVLERPVKNPAALFVFLIKKHNQERKDANGPQDSKDPGSDTK